MPHYSSPLTPPSFSTTSSSASSSSYYSAYSCSPRESSAFPDTSVTTSPVGGDYDCTNLHYVSSHSGSFPHSHTHGYDDPAPNSPRKSRRKQNIQIEDHTRYSISLHQESSAARHYSEAYPEYSLEEEGFEDTSYRIPQITISSSSSSRPKERSSRYYSLSGYSKEGGHYSETADPSGHGWVYQQHQHQHQEGTGMELMSSPIPPGPVPRKMSCHDYHGVYYSYDDRHRPGSTDSMGEYEESLPPASRRRTSYGRVPLWYEEREPFTRYL
ncbi:hypothetical protein BDZ91DRAFT_803086 [Kalaharituber pfeilii]|nr:hypothetical protein BDZ91DRAFT_803086 [Kalaharituber pfeilii]